MGPGVNVISPNITQGYSSPNRKTIPLSSSIAETEGFNRAHLRGEVPRGGAEVTIDLASSAEQPRRVTHIPAAYAMTRPSMSETGAMCLAGIVLRPCLSDRPR